jgi:hypothetical protein
MKKDPQSVAQEKRAEKYHYDMQSAVKEWETKLKTEELSASLKIQAVGLASKVSCKTAQELVENSRIIHDYLTEEIKQIEFVAPENPTPTSNIVTI